MRKMFKKPKRAFSSIGAFSSPNTCNLKPAILLVIYISFLEIKLRVLRTSHAMSRKLLYDLQDAKRFRNRKKFFCCDHLRSFFFLYKTLLYLFRKCSALICTCNILFSFSIFARSPVRDNIILSFRGTGQNLWYQKLFHSCSKIR